MSKKRMWEDFDDSFLFEDVGKYEEFKPGDRLEFMDFDGDVEVEEDSYLCSECGLRFYESNPCDCNY